MRRSSRACGTRGLAFPLIPRTARTADRCRPHGSRAGADGHWDRGGDGCPRGEHRAHHDGPIVAAQSSGTVLAPAPPARGPSRRSLVADGVRSTGTGTREALDRGALTRPASPVKRVGKGPVVGLRGGPRPPRRHGAPQGGRRRRRPGADCHGSVLALAGPRFGRALG